MPAHNGAKEVRISEPQTDTPSGRPFFISHEHARVHEGISHTVSHIFTGVAVDGFADLRFTSGGAPCHVFVNCASSGPAYYHLYEGATFSGPGTAKQTFNRKRTSSITAASKAYFTPTVNVPGTSIQSGQFLPGGVGVGFAYTGGTLEHKLEWILKPNTEHLIRMTNKDGAGATMSLTLNWYEVNDAG